MFSAFSKSPCPPPIRPPVRPPRSTFLRNHPLKSLLLSHPPAIASPPCPRIPPSPRPKFPTWSACPTRSSGCSQPFCFCRTTPSSPPPTSKCGSAPSGRTSLSSSPAAALDSLQGDAAQNRISILAELTRLRRYCCHPSLVLGPEAQTPAAKLDALLDLLANLRENGHRALVFSQFTDFLAIVRRALDAASFPHLYLDGATPSAERARLVDAFQRGEGDFFLISLKAGGLGLNLTAANYVILLAPWWNPAVEQQAADRAHRIGQHRPVTVYRLVAADTVEERVLALHAEKNALSADLLLSLFQ